MSRQSPTIRLTNGLSVVGVDEIGSAQPRFRFFSSVCPCRIPCRAGGRIEPKQLRCAMDNEEGAWPNALFTSLAYKRVGAAAHAGDTVRAELEAASENRQCLTINYGSCF